MDLLCTTNVTKRDANKNSVPWFETEKEVGVTSDERREEITNIEEEPKRDMGVPRKLEKNEALSRKRIHG